MAEEIHGEDLPDSLVSDVVGKSDTEPLEGTPVPVFNPGADSSLIDVFKEELRELSETEFVYIPILGYERTGLQAKYHLPERGKDIATVGQKVMRETKDVYSRNLFMAMDTMILLCDGLYVQPEGVEEPEPLDFDNVGYPVQFDERLAELISMNGDVQSARMVVRKLFGDNEMAILTHADKLQRWLQNTKANLNREVWELGE